MAQVVAPSRAASVLAMSVSTARITEAASIPAASIAARSPDRPPPQAEGREHGDEAAEKRGDAVRPDRIGGGDAGRPRRGGEGKLQPVDADRLAVARLRPVADLDVVARLQHLLRALHEAGLSSRSEGGMVKKPGSQSSRQSSSSAAYGWRRAAPQGRGTAASGRGWK